MLSDEFRRVAFSEGGAKGRLIVEEGGTRLSSKVTQRGAPRLENDVRNGAKMQTTIPFALLRIERGARWVSRLD